MSLIEHLDNYLELITYGFTNPMPDSNEGPWKITAKDVINGKINYDTARKTTIDSFENDLTPKSKPKINDILLTKDGTLGRLAIVDQENICVNQSVAVLRPNKKIIPQFLYYLLSSPYYQKTMLNDSDGSVLKHIYITRVKKMDVQIPDLTHQKKIIQILELIDNKIDVLIKLNKNLEELMHVLFKKYFIDNNPFYVENDEKWNIIKLKDLIIRNRDKINDFDNWKDELLIDLSNMPRFSIAISNFDKGKKFTSNIYKLNKYDLLFGSIRPYFGKVGFSPINGVVTGTVHSFKPIDDIYYSLVLSLISSKTFINYTVSVSKGTKMPSVKWDDFINYEFAIPDDLSKIGEYNKILLPLIHKIEKNILEIQRLTKLRDTLLPKLMSGEIDVSKINCDLE